MLIIIIFEDFYSFVKENKYETSSTVIMLLRYGKGLEDEKTSLAEFMKNKIVTRTQLLEIGKSFSIQIKNTYKKEKKSYYDFIEESKDF